MRNWSVWCLIPVYNHAATVAEVALGAARFLPGKVLVADDGSTDWPEHLDAFLAAHGIEVLHLPRNRGKGAAILAGLAHPEVNRADYLITLDADGQHDPGDLPALLEILRDAAEPDLLLVGCRDFSVANVPRTSKFGRKFSNFWFFLESGEHCADTQSGFRAYPVAALKKMRFLARRYNFETEVLTRAAWGGVRIVDVPVRVHYPERGKRISHFHKFRDNFRISLIHIHLIAVRLLPVPHRSLVGKKRPDASAWSILRHPGEFLKRLLRENATPGGLALAAWVGSFLAVLPLVGCHMAVILYVCIRFRLNKAMALAIQNLFMPPLSPFLCIELGYFLRHGRFWTELTLDSVTKELHFRLYEWLLGSLILAPFFATVAALAVYGAASVIRRRRS